MRSTTRTRAEKTPHIRSKLIPNQMTLVLSGSLVALVQGACGGAGADKISVPLAIPGTITAVLTTPNSNDGAILFEVKGGTIDSVTSAGFPVQASAGSTATVIVVGTLTTGIAIAKLWVPNINAISSYSAIVTQAAARSYAQQTVSSYKVTFR